MSATARATTRPSSRQSSQQGSRTRRPALREVPPPAPAVAGNGMFALIVAGMLVLGMVGLLVLNTTLAQGAFEIGSLTKVQRDLAVNEQRLLQKVAHAEAPESLQERADQLGMVPAQAPVFLRLADRTVLGQPTPAKAGPRKASGSGAAAAATVPSTSGGTTSDAAAADTTTGGRTTTSRAGGGTAAAAAPDMSDEARPDAPTGPSISDEARPDAPTGEPQP
jgi:hypothetical protein